MLLLVGSSERKKMRVLVNERVLRSIHTNMVCCSFDLPHCSCVLLTHAHRRSRESRTERERAGDEVFVCVGKRANIRLISFLYCKKNPSKIRPNK